MDKNSRNTRSNIMLVHGLLFLAFIALASQTVGTVSTVAFILSLGALLSAVVTFLVTGGE